MTGDPAQIDPRHVKVTLENDRVRVLHVTIGPHENVPMHSHPSAVGIFLTDGWLRNFVPGRGFEDVRADRGATFWFQPVTHASENAGKTPLELVLVELKQPSLR